MSVLGFIRSIRRDTRAASAAEMALVLPMLLVLMFGGFEGGFYMWNEHKVVKAVRDGARYAGRLPFSAYDCSSDTVGQTYRDNIANLTRTGSVDGTAGPRVIGWTNNATQVSVNLLACDTSTKTGLFEDQANGAIRVRVSADIPYPSLFASLGFPTAGLRLRASSQAVVMGL